MRVTVIDFETNGFQGSEVLSFSYAHQDDDGTSTPKESRYYYAHGEYNEKAIAVNGLTEERIRWLRGDADYPRHYDEDVEFIRSVFAHTDVIVAHNIAFDHSFLPALPDPQCQVFCTMKANTKYFDKNPKLKEAAEYYGIEVAEENLHGSAYDVELCLAIYNAMKEEDKTPSDDFLSKVYAARDEYGNKIHPFGKWKGFSYAGFTEKDCEEFLEKYNGPHTHEMYEDVFSWNENLIAWRKEKAELLRLASLSPYAQMFSDERQRQITEEGWTPEHDDEHVNGELADVAACYATAHRWVSMGGIEAPLEVYPENWDLKWFKKQKHDRKRQLIIAGALLIAELERLDRAEVAQCEAKIPC